MAETTQFTIGADVSCTDGVCGEVSRVVVDPVARAVTHLVVEPKHRQGLARLVPLDLVDAAAGEIRLRCTWRSSRTSTPPRRRSSCREAAGTRATARNRCSPGRTTAWVVRAWKAISSPEPAPSPTTRSRWARWRCAAASTSMPPTARSGESQGLVIDPQDHHVTHVLLQEGHLWGRKEVAIPISAVTGVDDGIRLNITKQQVQDLPPVDIDHPDV